MNQFCFNCGGKFVNGVCEKCGKTLFAQENEQRAMNPGLCPHCNVPYNQFGTCPQCGSISENSVTQATRATQAVNFPEEQNGGTQAVGYPGGYQAPPMGYPGSYQAPPMGYPGGYAPARQTPHNGTPSGGKKNSNAIWIAISSVALIAIIVVVALFAINKGVFNSGGSGGNAPEPAATHSTATTTTTAAPTTTTTTEPGNYPPKFTKFTASSFYYKDEANKCKIEYAFDNKPGTCWQDGVDGYGIGEWLEASASSNQLVSCITFYNGFQKKNSMDLYNGNSRVKAITVYWEGGSKSFSLTDTKPPQFLWLDEPVSTRYVRVVIDDVYEGDRYADTCIADIVIE
ncbi:MAG: discoidin domain-containing protein [Ruminococcaceae bacterium]|nr:discoidin domain-containing protein [Oscillospiraceae bacterium]